MYCTMPPGGDRKNGKNVHINYVAKRRDLWTVPRQFCFILPLTIIAAKKFDFFRRCMIDDENGNKGNIACHAYMV